MRAAAAAVSALLVAAAAASAPAYGAPESSCGDGVLVVVAAPGGEEQADCVAQPGDRTAAELIEAAGYELTRAQRFPGAVCRVDGEPADQACVAMPPADAYWGLFLAEDGEWVYSALGVDALSPAPGEAVALAWQDTVSPVPPRDSFATSAPTRTDASRVASRHAPADGNNGLPPAVPLVVLAGLAAVVALAVWRRGT